MKTKPKTSRLSAGRVYSSLLLCALSLLALLPVPASARKTHLLRETFGSAAKPKFGGVNGLAVDQSSGDLLVIDVRNVDEQQKIEFSGFASGDSFNLSFKGESTAAIPYTTSFKALKENVQEALDAKFGAENISVSGTDPSVTVTFTGALGGTDQPQMTCATQAGSGSCTVQTIDTGHPIEIRRFKPNGEPDPFPALGTDVIDAKGTGKCATVPADCDQTPQNGFSFGTYPGEAMLAIDNSGTATDGDIYVAQPKAHVLDIFAASGKYLGQITKAGASSFTGFSPCGVAVDPGGNIFVSGAFGEEKIHKFDPSANPPLDSDYVASFTTVSKPCMLAAGAGPSAGSLFVNTLFTSKGNSVLQLDSSSGALKSIVEPEESYEVIVDSGTGHSYVLHVDLGSNNSPINPTIREYSGSTLVSITSFSKGGGSGEAIAVDGASGTLYTGLEKSVLVYGPTVTVPEATTEAATITSDTSATLHGTVNPDGVALEDCRFEYGTSTAYGQTAPCAESVAEIGSGSIPKPVHADLSGLGSETLYHFRLVAKNANAALYPNDPTGTARGADRTFKTPSKPAIGEEQAADVGFTEARLKAQVNPENSPTSYRFEWGTDTSYGQSTAEIAIGSGEAAHAVSLALDGLKPGTTYHYRVVATNTIGVSEGADHAFTTFEPLSPGEGGLCANEALRAGPAAFLPDCRAYEMVSPLDKNNGDIIPPEEPSTHLPAGLNQSSLSGQRLTYSSYRAFGDAQSAAYSAQYIAARDPEAGWQTHAILPPRAAPVLAGPKQQDTEFKAFSADLCNTWLRTVAEPQLEPLAIARVPNLYRRQDEECGGPAYEALTTVAPTHETSDTPFAAQHYTSLELQGTSADGSKAIYAVVENLSEEAPPQPKACLDDLEGFANCKHRLYEYSSADHTPHYVCILPGGGAVVACAAGSTVDATGSGRENQFDNAISRDGSRIFWSSFSGLQPGKIYMRENADQEQSAIAGGQCTEADKACTVAVSKEGEALSGTTASQYWSAAEDGSKAIFSSGEDLYEFDVEAGATNLIAHKVKGVLGTSEDASHVYFVSSENLGGGAVAGQQNLYLYHGGSYKFVAALANADVSAGHPAPVAPEPRNRTSRVSPDGRHAAFMSFGSLTGYDNTDANSGKADAEVYLYDADANGGAGKLICASCNPSGARPVSDGTGVNNAVFWAAAQIPRWQSSLYSGRSLSDDGKRLYFASTDVLSPRDTNGRQDVYQWEAPGTGGCDAADPGFVVASGGCLSLISSGKSPRDAEFVDVSPSGEDVFFSTLSSLVSQDYGLVDIYDARVGGGFPEPPSTRAPCEGEACQSPPEAPEDPTPASSAFQGAGNVVEEKPPSCRKPKVRRRGRCVARKHHKRAAHKHKRANDKGRAGR